MTTLADSLAVAYEKPVEYVNLCLKTFAHPKSWPIVRFSGDGFDEFFSALTALYSTEPSRTKQEFTAECDINNIMARFQASNYDPSTLPITSRKSFYGDITSMPESYHAALNYVKDTERAFLELPAEFRAKFDNDPQGFIDYVQDPANADELRELGFLAPASVIPAPQNSAVGDDDGITQGGSTPPKGKSSVKPVKPASGGIEGD